MSTFLLKIIAVIAMLLDHIAYFFPDLPFALFLHWIGRISAPLFMFCVVIGVKETNSIKKYLFRLYLASVAMSFIQSFTQLEFNFFRTLFILALICSLIELIEYDNIFHFRSAAKRLYVFGAYQIFTCIICLLLTSASNASTESFCFFLLPALTGSVLTLEGGLSYVLLGLIFYIWFDNKPKMLLIGTLYTVGITIIQTLSVIPYLLFKIKVLIPYVGHFISECIELIFDTIIGLSPMDSGGNIFTTQYSWLLILSFPLIFLYNGKKGASFKQFFYLFYPLHIFLLWALSVLVYEL